MTDERHVDWGATGRRDYYRLSLVDPFTLQEVGSAELESGSSSLTWSYGGENQLGASIDLAEGDYRQGGYDRMVRIHHTVEIGDFAKDYTMGTLFVSNMSARPIYRQSRRTLQCYGPWWRHTQDVFALDFTRNPGDNAVDGIRYLVEVDGGTLVIGPGVDTGRLHVKGLHCSAGQNKGEVLRAYAGFIGCELITDVSGALELREYVPPQDREPVYTFTSGANCIYLSGYGYETNRDEPINKVVAYFSRESKQDDDPYPLSDSVQVYLNPADDYSFQRCGRNRTQVLQVNEPCSHEDLQAHAQRVLDERSAAIEYVTIEHAGVPWLRVGDCVRYVNDVDGPVDTIAIIEEMAVQSLGPWCRTKTKLRCYL